MHYYVKTCHTFPQTLLEGWLTSERTDLLAELRHGQKPGGKAGRLRQSGGGQVR